MFLSSNNMGTWRMTYNHSSYRWGEYFHWRHSNLMTTFTEASRFNYYRKRQFAFQTIQSRGTSFQEKHQSCNERPKMTNEIDNVVSSSLEQQKITKNPVSALQEICVKKGWHLPYYRTENLVLPRGISYLTVCEVENVNSCGRDSKKRISKRKAALDMLNYLKDSGMLTKLGEKDIFENASLSYEFIDTETVGEENHLLKVSETEECRETKNDEVAICHVTNLSNSDKNNDLQSDSVDLGINQESNEQKNGRCNGNQEGSFDGMGKDYTIIPNAHPEPSEKEFNNQIHFFSNEIDEFSDEETYVKLPYNNKRVAIKHAKGATPKRLKLMPEEQEALLKLNNLRIFECISRKEDMHVSYQRKTVIERTISK